MASPQQHQASSGSDGDQRYAMFDERKRKRMISNRESARRSRMKKQQQLEELISQVTVLKHESNVVRQKIDALLPMFDGVVNENNVLRAQLSELTGRFQSLNSILHIAQELSGNTVDIPELPPTLVEPWQLPCPVQPIAASMDVFNKC